ncbi:hypothetical protein [Thioalkalivibrio denitrificans]|uniref:hypothetical protein n=1 Tax=Thioalkalivibrio denitrificans TaxID=108003 RepID=UPI00158BCEF1|nr:hypothetical protein [Thioalkalivibrio denitrificans]
MKKHLPKSATKRRPSDQDRLIRAVASSTAIETGESIQAIEQRLKTGRSRFRHLKLA